MFLVNYEFTKTIGNKAYIKFMLQLTTTHKRVKSKLGQNLIGRDWHFSTRIFPEGK